MSAVKVSAASIPDQSAETRATDKRESVSFPFSTIAFYAIVTLIIIAGWRLSDLQLLHASSGLGYWLGILGASLMGLLLLYPLRKRLRVMRRLGPVRWWFRIHMVFGILGPLLIILHSNFQLGSFNSRIALFTTLIVAGSGIIGRYLYGRIHFGLYGQRASLNEIRDRVMAERDNAGGVGGLSPALEPALQRFEARYLADQGFFGSFLDATVAPARARWVYWRLLWAARRDIDQAAQRSEVIQTHKRRLRRSLKSYLQRRLGISKRMAQFRASERLFALWHVVHYPLFLVMVLAVIVHVLAVHMY